MLQEGIVSVNIMSSLLNLVVSHNHAAFKNSGKLEELI